MINWYNPRFDPPPAAYECLFCLSNEQVVLGKYADVAKTDAEIIGWSVANRPAWVLSNRKKSGHVFGEKHPRATISDNDCELIRQLHEEGMSYRKLAVKFDRSRSTIRDIVKFRRRQKPTEY